MIKCEVCQSAYEDGRESCPACGIRNPLFVSRDYVKIELEIERPLLRAMNAYRKSGQLIEELIIEMIEEYVSRRQK